MVYCIALTGGLASGKSTAAKLFSELGIRVIDADQISKRLTAKNELAYHEIIKHFGTEVIDSNGELNRKHLRTLIFNDPLERIWLEQLLHPLIRKKIKEQVDSCITPYCVAEIPLLIDKTNYPYVDKILLITAPKETQIARVMERDNCSQTQALAILAAQPQINLRLLHADDVLSNDAGFSEFKKAINNLHKKYLQFAAEAKS